MVFGIDMEYLGWRGSKIVYVAADRSENFGNHLFFDVKYAVALISLYFYLLASNYAFVTPLPTAIKGYFLLVNADLAAEGTIVAGMYYGVSLSKLKGYRLGYSISMKFHNKEKADISLHCYNDVIRTVAPVTISSLF